MKRLHDARRAAAGAARAAGDLVRGEFAGGRDGAVRAKDANDFVTRTDVESERLIKERLAGAFPGIPFLAEESAARIDADVFWVIDPLDGTTNFMHRYPQVGISIALVEGGDAVAGVVFDPLRDELFEAVKGGGSFCNGRPIRVSSASGLGEALLGTGFPFRVHEYLDDYLAVFRDLFVRCHGIRRAGAAVLDLAHVAAGRLDGFWELALRPWDIAAGALLVREAGGVVTDFFGGDTFLSSGNIVAGPAAVHAAIAESASKRFTPERVRPLAVDLF
ncbi:MAG: inositol monophosphatase family protein [Candidatus Krumholzibacteria bacterium]|nr:inositol monophosphatase family protein [Candidatus Krumholzibacteria bacterium]